MTSKIASTLLRTLALTWRIHVEGTLPQAPCIIAFWHGEMLPIWFAMRKRKPVALVSASKDGDYLSALLADWGYNLVRGSSSKGGSEALDAMISNARNNIVMITPDGPRGPAHVCKPGVVVAAQRAGVPLVLMRAYCSRVKVFTKSWDDFQLPLLFAHLTIHVSHPINVNASTREETDAVIQNVERRLNNLGSITI